MKQTARWPFLRSAVAAAAVALGEPPIPTAHHRAPLRAGGPHDFFAMSDYRGPDPEQPDGSFPLELKRTKPYASSIFQLDNLASPYQLLSMPEDNLWTFALSDGRGGGMRWPRRRGTADQASALRAQAVVHALTGLR